MDSQNQIILSQSSPQSQNPKNNEEVDPEWINQWKLLELIVLLVNYGDEVFEELRKLNIKDLKLEKPNKKEKKKNEH